MPSEAADARVVGADTETGVGAAMAAAAFLTELRGLPLEELDIDTDCGVYRIISANNPQKREILLPKCKLLCAKTPITVENIEIFVSVVSDGHGMICTVKCSDVATFSESALCLLPTLLCDKYKSIDTAVAYSVTEGKIHAVYTSTITKKSPVLRCATAVACCVGCGVLRPSVTVTLDGTELYVRCEGGKYAVRSPSSQPLMLIAPDIF